LDELEGVTPVSTDGVRRGSRGPSRGDRDRFASTGSDIRGSRTSTPTGRGGRGREERGGRRQGGRKQTAPTETLAPSATGYKISTAKDELEALRRRVQSLLNKLTPEKFEKLVGQFYELVIDSPDKLRELISVVFAKAVDEQSFSALYAELCVRLGQKLPAFQDPVNPEGKEIVCVSQKFKIFKYFN